MEEYEEEVKKKESERKGIEINNNKNNELMKIMKQRDECLRNYEIYYIIELVVVVCKERKKER